MEKQFKVSSEIYGIWKIQEAISDFSDIADVSFHNDVLLMSWETDEDIHETFSEFMNYILSM
jgi:hypothetical protein